MTQTKITLRIESRLLQMFDDKLKSLFIKRDAFLNHIIKNEVPYLLKEIGDLVLSKMARLYISRELKRLGTKNINVVVDKETSELLNEVVKRKNIVRDAFVNRLILHLLSRDKFLDYMDLPRFINHSEFESYFEQLPTAPLDILRLVIEDPLYYQRLGAEERHRKGLYLLDMPEKLVGFSCFLHDYQIPGSVPNEELKQIGEKLLQEFDQAFDSEKADYRKKEETVQ